MEIEFAGAAREVTGSCHIVRANGKTVLLDCGLFQGKRQDADAKNRALPCAIEEIDAVVLSHAHLDHAGRLPFLTNRGYSKAIHATRLRPISSRSCSPTARAFRRMTTCF